MVITIDGPAGAGKSSVSRKLAEALGFAFLDTGAMYRAVTWAVIRQGVSMSDSEGVVRVAESIDLQLLDDRVMVDGVDVSGEIRTPEVTRQIRHVADSRGVRQRLSQMQREIAADTDYVTEGRDQGTEVFRDAACKIFLTASARERAQRRHQQLVAGGGDVSLEEVLADQTRRDQQDEGRAIGRLRPATDAVELLTDGMSEEAVVARLVQIVREAISKA